MRAEGDALSAQVVRGLAQAMKQRDGSLTLRLKPAELGTLRVDVAVRSERVVATLRTQTDQARELLHSNLAHLRTALEARGLAVERIEVAGPAEQFPFGHTSEDGAEDDPPQRDASHSAGDRSRDDSHARAGVRDDPGRGGTDAQEAPEAHEHEPGAEPLAASAEPDAELLRAQTWDAERSLGVLRLDTLA